MRNRVTEILRGVFGWAVACACFCLLMISCGNIREDREMHLPDSSLISEQGPGCTEFQSCINTTRSSIDYILFTMHTGNGVGEMLWSQGWVSRMAEFISLLSPKAEKRYPGNPLLISVE